MSIGGIPASTLQKVALYSAGTGALAGLGFNLLADAATSARSDNSVLAGPNAVMGLTSITPPNCNACEPVFDVLTDGSTSVD